MLTRGDAAALLAGWRRLYGGGALRGGRLPGGDPCFELEVQSDHADGLVGELQRAGYHARRGGG